MKKYEKMIKINNRASQEKVSRAIFAIDEMIDNDEKIAISILTKKTGLSRGFFYKNVTVREKLNSAWEAQKGRVFHSPHKVILDQAMEKQIVILKGKVEKLEAEVNEQKKENDKLKKLLQRKELKLLKQL